MDSFSASDSNSLSLTHRLGTLFTIQSSLGTSVSLHVFIV